MVAKYRLDCKLVNWLAIYDRTEPQYLSTDDDLSDWVERQNKVPSGHPLKMSWVLTQWDGEKYVRIVT